MGHTGARAMASPQAGAAGGGAEQPGEALLPTQQTASWRTWHSDSDLTMRRSLIESMCVLRMHSAAAWAPGRAG